MDEDSRRRLRTSYTDSVSPRPSAVQQVRSGASEPVGPAHRKRRRKRHLNRKKLLIIIIVIVAIAAIVGGVLFGLSFKEKRDQTQKNKHSVSAKTTFPGISFPIYYPSNLAPGFAFNDDAKVLKDNVLFYSVTDPEGKKFFVTLQPIPPAFNYATFNDKFLKPHQYTTNIGSVVAGQVGANLIASIQTSDNVWIIINADGKNSQASLETITRSFEKAQ